MGSSQVAEQLRRHDLHLGLDKEEYQVKLIEIFEAQDLGEQAVGTVDTTPAI